MYILLRFFSSISTNLVNIVNIMLVVLLSITANSQYPLWFEFQLMIVWYLYFSWFEKEKLSGLLESWHFIGCIGIPNLARDQSCTWRQFASCCRRWKHFIMRLIISSFWLQLNNFDGLCEQVLGGRFFINMYTLEWFIEIRMFPYIILGNACVQ